MTKPEVDTLEACKGKIDTALSRIRQRWPIDEAIIGSGINHESWKEWRELAAKGIPEYVLLKRRLDQAYAEARGTAIAEVGEVDPKLWLSKAGREPAIEGGIRWVDSDGGSPGGLAAAASIDIVQLRATLIERVTRIAASGVTATGGGGDGGSGDIEAAARLVDVGQADGPGGTAQIPGPDAAAAGSDPVRDLADHDRPGLGQDTNGRGNHEG